MPNIGSASITNIKSLFEHSSSAVKFYTIVKINTAISSVLSYLEHQQYLRVPLHDRSQYCHNERASNNVSLILTHPSHVLRLRKRNIKDRVQEREHPFPNLVQLQPLDLFQRSAFPQSARAKSQVWNVCASFSGNPSLLSMRTLSTISCCLTNPEQPKADRSILRHT